MRAVAGGPYRKFIVHGPQHRKPPAPLTGVHAASACSPKANGAALWDERAWTLISEKNPFVTASHDATCVMHETSMTWSASAMRNLRSPAQGACRSGKWHMRQSPVRTENGLCISFAEGV
jgi:hypothetical protein